MLTDYMVICPHCHWAGCLLPQGNRDAWKAAIPNARVITFHSPMPMRELWNEEKPYAFAAGSFRRTVFAASYPKGENGYVIALPDDQPAPTGKVRNQIVIRERRQVGSALY